MNDLITIDKAVKWLEEHIYAGFDSMCLDYERKDLCINDFIKDMKNPDYGVKKYDDEDDW